MRKGRVHRLALLCCNLAVSRYRHHYTRLSASSLCSYEFFITIGHDIEILRGKRFFLFLNRLSFSANPGCLVQEV